MFRKLLLPFVLLLVPGVAHADWQEATSEHFVIYADESPSAVKSFAERLERFDRAVRTLLKLPEHNIGPNARVRVFVVPGLSEVQRAAGMSGVAGFYQEQYPSGPFAFVPRRSSGDADEGLSAQAILQHEYTHHLMFSSWPGVVFPVWFSEGFAELFATARFNSDGSIQIGGVPTYRNYGIDQSMQVPINNLVTGTPNYHDAFQSQVFYGRSWLLMHYLIFDKERAKQLAAYIVALNDGKSLAEAAQVLGVRSSLDAKLNSYGSQSRLPISAVPAAQLTIAPVSVRALSAGEAAVMPAVLRSSAGVDPKQALEVVALARRLAAPFPNDAGAQNELAEAEFDAKNYALSEAAADRALAADPKSMHATIYKGMAAMEQAKAAKTSDPAAFAAARRHFLAANKLDPLYSYPIQLYYESFQDAKQAPSKPAQDGLIYAYQLFPGNMQLRLEAAHVLLAQGNVPAARVALEPVAFNPHGEKLGEAARKVVDTLDKSGAPAALTALDEGLAKLREDAKDGKKDKKD